jgi:hypothetical protein
MSNYIPPQGRKKRDYGIYPPQGVKIKIPVIPPPPPPPPPPPEVYIDVYDSASGIELIEVAQVAFTVEHNLVNMELTTQSFTVEHNLVNNELILATPTVEHNLVTMELSFPA